MSFQMLSPTEQLLIDPVLFPAGLRPVFQHVSPPPPRGPLIINWGWRLDDMFILLMYVNYSSGGSGSGWMASEGYLLDVSIRQLQPGSFHK